MAVRWIDNCLHLIYSASMGLRAFSLLELLITMALIIILYVMLMSPSSKSYQERQKIACQNNLRNIYIALKIYAMENQDSFPMTKQAVSSEAPLSLLIPKYTTVTEIFICPGSDDSSLPSGEPFSTRKISYAYYATTADGPGFLKQPHSSPSSQ